MKSANSNLKKWLHLRISDAEHRIIKKKQADSTSRTLSQYLRTIIFERPVIATYRNRSQDEMVQQIVVLNRELAAIGNNLNQVTKKLHTLQTSEKQSWDLQFKAHVEAAVIKISEIKRVMEVFTIRWLR